jgi:hypothetical protein
MLSKGEKSHLLSLLRSQDWPIAEKLAQLLIQKIIDAPASSATEWETVKSALQKEYQVEGIRLLLKEIENQALDPELH